MKDDQKQIINNAPFFYVTKIDAARRQLDVAIRLYFYDEDVVATYTLVWAVYNLLSDLIKKQGLKSDLDRDLNWIIPKERKEIRDLFRSAGNYFKHADDKNYDKPLKFFYKPVEMYLFDSCRMYYTLTNNNPPTIGIYKSWFHLTHKGLLMPDLEEKLEKSRQHIDITNKLKFFNDILPTAMKITK
jgi:hypothetical protein